MANIDARLSRLSNRRRGFDRLDALSEAAQYQVIAKAITDEAYQQRAAGKPNTKYALGAMQEVDAEYTRIGVEEATRVGNQLATGLRAAGISPDFRLQGSVPLNIHIRGVSDVDLLTLDIGFLTNDPDGLRARAGAYITLSGTALAGLQALRSAAESILETAFPKAKVDRSGSKAIKLTGGSLRRPVDVVPSHWHDTAEYQRSGSEHDRGVKILDTSGPRSLLNMPFKHIQKIEAQDGACLGGLKKAIRLCKNIKADAVEDGTDIKLPSFDIAAIMYHAHVGSLAAGIGSELAILAESRRHLDALARNLSMAATLRTPDGSRYILDTAEKQNALVKLSIEVDNVSECVAREQAALLPNLNVSGDQILEALKKAHVPA